MHPWNTYEFTILLLADKAGCRYGREPTAPHTDHCRATHSEKLPNNVGGRYGAVYSYESDAFCFVMIEPLTRFSMWPWRRRYRQNPSGRGLDFLITRDGRTTADRWVSWRLGRIHPIMDIMLHHDYYGTSVWAQNEQERCRCTSVARACANLEGSGICPAVLSVCESATSGHRATAPLTLLGHGHAHPRVRKLCSRRLRNGTSSRDRSSRNFQPGKEHQRCLRIFLDKI